jgi:hypothetical protein
MYLTYLRDLQLLRADSLRQLKSFGDDLIDSELYMVLIRTHARIPALYDAGST